MKTIPISMLVLIAFPIHLMGQQSNDFKPLSSTTTQPQASNYFADHNQQIETAANHIMSSSRNSHRKGEQSLVDTVLPAVSPTLQMGTPSRVSTQWQKPVVQLSQPVVQQPSAQVSSLVKFSAIETEPLRSQLNETSTLVNETVEKVVEFSQTETRTVSPAPISGGDFSLKARADRIALAPFKPLQTNEFEPLRMASTALPLEERPWQDIEVVSPSDVILNEKEIVRPTPQNTDAGEFVPPAPSRPQYTVEVNESGAGVQAVEPEVDNTYAEENYVITAPETMSLDDMQMAARANSSNREPSAMRHVSDHFSPGGEPFALQNGMRNTNVFGMDANSVCDEWTGICDCNSSLKSNPGHYGRSWLRGTDACETVTPNCTRKGLFGSKCSDCNDDCGCQNYQP